MVKVLVVGQTPPPHGGQAIMIQSLLDGPLPDVELFHVRMGFSRTMAEMGQLRPRKLAHAVGVLGAIVYGRIRHGADVLYYPPSGPSRVAMLRDCALLIPTRWMFKKTVFHFHAGGSAELYARLSRVEKALFMLAHDRPDCTIRTSPSSPPDGELVHSALDVVVPYGIDDAFEPHRAARQAPREGRRPVILFVGVLRESKGLDVLVRAARALKDRGLDFEVRAVGQWQSEDYRARVEATVAEHGLADRFSFPGVLTGDAKHRAYADADVFCFPSFFEAETFGLVVLEAMSFALPIVTTRWRGLPALVEEGTSGFVVPTEDAGAIADKLALLLEHPTRAREMGEAGRARYLAGYTRGKFLERMRETLLRVAGEAST